jgi:hypothetical protein
MVRQLTARDLGWRDRSVRRSTTSVSTPNRPRRIAAESPTGPAPMIRTSTVRFAGSFRWFTG